MATGANQSYLGRVSGDYMTWGLFWLLAMSLAAAVFFSHGVVILIDAWSEPEYSHGPLIPVLSGIMFLRELKQFPPQPGPKSDRWQGVIVVLLAVLLAGAGKLLKIDSFEAYAIIVWVAGVILISFGWNTGKHFWPSVLHLVFMLPLPGMLYYEVSTFLQLVSSELGVWFLRMANVPVYLNGNIIDLGVLKMHVAEACSGLRYMFPIMSFSYIFAVLYQGPSWHKMVLLLAAAPIAILMNSIRIAMAGILMQHFGPEWLEGFTHLFEGWVIFIASILILFALAWLMLWLNPRKMSLAEALDLETEGLATQLGRIKYVYPSKALITASVVMIATVSLWPLIPHRDAQAPARLDFAVFPKQIGDWRQFGSEQRFSPKVERILAADDYINLQYGRAVGEPTLDFFAAWYHDLAEDGVVHTPEICLPGAGWEIAKVERVDISSALGLATPYEINRVVIQKGEQRRLVYYWFKHMGVAIPRNTRAKFNVLTGGVMAGRYDGAIVRIISPIAKGEPEGVAEAKMNDLLKEMLHDLPRFVPS